MEQGLLDIQTDTDLETVFRTFYAKAMNDPVIGTYFTGIHHMDLEAHLPKMVAFWRNALFHTGGYEGNMILVHQRFHDMQAFEPSHFQRWLELFNDSVSGLFAGPVTEQAKASASIIATILARRLGA